MTYRDGPVTAQSRRRSLFALFWAGLFIGVVITFHAVLVPFVVGALIAYVLTPVARGLTRVRFGSRRLPPWGAVLVIYALIVAGLVLGVRKAAPWIAVEVREFLRNEVPRIREEAGTRWLPKLRSVSERWVSSPHNPGTQAGAPSPEDHNVSIEPHPGGGYVVRLPAEGVQIERRNDRLYRVTTEPVVGESHHDDIDTWLDELRALGAGHTEDLLQMGRGIVGSIVGGVFSFFITLMLSAYLILTHERIFAFAESLVQPTWRTGFQELLQRIDRGLSGVVRGQLVICVVNGALSAVGFMLANLPYWPVLALFATVFSIIPIFGAFLSGIPAVAIGLRAGIPTGLFVFVWILGIHQLEANVLNPKIMGDAAKINPVLIIFSLLAGEHLFGILGALLAVPTMSIVQSVFLHTRKYVLDYGDPGVMRDSMTPPPLMDPASTAEDAPSGGDERGRDSGRQSTG